MQGGKKTFFFFLTREVTPAGRACIQRGIELPVKVCNTGLDYCREHRVDEYFLLHMAHTL